jgi:transposase
MSKPYPLEFSHDVVAVAGKQQAPLSQMAKDFGNSESYLANWLKNADVEEGVKPGVREYESAELRCRKTRT